MQEGRVLQTPLSEAFPTYTSFNVLEKGKDRGFKGVVALHAKNRLNGIYGLGVVYAHTFYLAGKN